MSKFAISAWVPRMQKIYFFQIFFSGFSPNTLLKCCHQFWLFSMKPHEKIEPLSLTMNRFVKCLHKENSGHKKIWIFTFCWSLLDQQWLFCTLYFLLQWHVYLVSSCILNMMTHYELVYNPIEILLSICNTIMVCNIDG